MQSNFLNTMVQCYVQGELRSVGFFLASSHFYFPVPVFVSLTFLAGCPTQTNTGDTDNKLSVMTGWHEGGQQE